MSRPVQYIHLRPNTSPSAQISERPFSVVVIITAEVTPEWRHKISEWLVKEGCLCMMAWGIDCSLWDDSVDVANLQAFDWGDIPEGRSIMTTWHDGEPLSDVFWNANMSIFHPPDVSLEHLVILDISDEERESEIRELFDKSCEGSEVELIENERNSTSAVFEKFAVGIAYVLAVFVGINENPLVQVICLIFLFALFGYSLWRKFVLQTVYTGVGVLGLLIILYT